MNRRSRPARLAALLVFAAAAWAAVPSVQSVKPASPILLDGKTDDWTGVALVPDRKTGSELAFANDARYLYVLVVIRDSESQKSAEASGLTIVGRPRSSRKPAKGALFVTREISADGFIAWRESQGAVLTDEDKAQIRRTPRHPVSVAFAVDEKGSSYGPLRKQTDLFPPDFAARAGDGETVYEFRIPLASPDVVAGAIGGVPGGEIRVRLGWGGESRKSLSTQASRETPSANSGYLSGTGRTWSQEFLDTFDTMSRPTQLTPKFGVDIDVKLADASEPGPFTNRGPRG